MSSDKPEKPPKRRWRGLAIGLGLFTLVIAGVVASAYLYRDELALAALRDTLGDAGFGNPRFKIEELSPDTLTIENFSADPAVRFDRLTIKFSLEKILTGKIDAVDLVGLDADLTRPGPWTASKASPDKGVADNVPPSFGLDDLPAISVRRARLRVPSPAGPVTVTSTISLAPGDGGARSLQASASVTGPRGDLSARYDGAIHAGTDGNLAADGRLSAMSESFEVGAIRLKSLTVDLPLSVTLPKGGEPAFAIDNAMFTADRLDLGPATGSGPIEATLTGRVTAALATGKWLDADAKLNLAAKDMRGGEIALGQLSTNLALELKAGPGAASLAIAPGGRLTASRIRTGKAALMDRFSTLLSGSVAVSWPEKPSHADGTGLAIDHALSLTPAPVTLSGTPATIAEPGKITASGKLDVTGAYTGQVDLDGSRLAHGDRSVWMAGIAARLAAQAGLTEPGINLSITGIRDLSPATVAGAAISGAYDLSATVRQTGRGFAFEGDIAGLGMKNLVTFKGLHTPSEGAGTADITIPTIGLGTTGIQPASIVPALALIKAVSGRIGGSASLTWSDRRLNGRAKVDMEGLGGKTETVSVAGVDGIVVIDRLIPLSTAPDQLLKIRRIEAGAALTDLSVRYALLPSGTLRIDRAAAEVADGKIILSAPAFDPATLSAKATLTLQGLQLEQLLRLADLGDLQASGRIHGVIPVLIKDGKIAIDSGALAAQGGGNLRFRSEQAKQVLKSGGEQVGLMLQALENFSYEQLGIDIDKSLDGNARVTLRTLGHNPAVLRGRKFQINVNLETNLDRLLAAALEWYRLSGRALQDIVRPGSRRRTR